MNDDFERKIVKYARISLATNKKLILIPHRRDSEGEIRWTIHLQSKVAEGIEDLKEFIDDIE